MRERAIRLFRVRNLPIALLAVLLFGAGVAAGSFGTSDSEVRSLLGWRSVMHISEAGADDPIVRGSHLARVIPIAQSCDAGGATVTLVSMEIYEDGSLLRYQLTSNGPALLGPSLDLFFEPTFDFRDNAGTTYRTFPSGGGGDDSLYRSGVNVKPPIEEAATSMTARLHWGRPEFNDCLLTFPLER
jgi:hypothetical protein